MAKRTMKAQVIGQVMNDPELRVTSGGQEVMSLKIKNPIGKNEHLLVSVTLWRRLAARMDQAIQKGDYVVAEGPFLVSVRGPDRSGDLENGTTPPLIYFDIKASRIDVIPRDDAEQLVEEFDEVSI